jgi:hypothetical protein
VQFIRLQRRSRYATPVDLGAFWEVAAQKTNSGNIFLDRADSAILILFFLT